MQAHASFLKFPFPHNIFCLMFFLFSKTKRKLKGSKRNSHSPTSIAHFKLTAVLQMPIVFLVPDKTALKMPAFRSCHPRCPSESFHSTYYHTSILKHTASLIKADPCNSFHWCLCAAQTVRHARQCFSWQLQQCWCFKAATPKVKTVATEEVKNLLQGKIRVPLLLWGWMRHLLNMIKHNSQSQ